MRQKYIDEKAGFWFVFGTNVETGNVDISDGNRDVFENIPLTLAEKIIESHNRHLEELYTLFGCGNEARS